MKKHRDQSGLFVGEGPKVVDELLQSFTCVYIAATQEWMDRHSSLKDCKIKYDILSDAELAKTSLMEAPQQVIGVFKKRPSTLPSADDLQSQLCLALDTIQDPGNMGTIVRLARWFGIDHIVCSPDCADIYSPKVVQATMGALGKVSIGSVVLSQFICELPKEVPVYGTFLGGKDIYHCELSANGIIVMGNEGNGISPEVATSINHKLYIPPFPPGSPTIESLNVGVATAIVCAEFRRRQLSNLNS